jgi:hypothetical protein
MGASDLVRRHVSDVQMASAIGTVRSIGARVLNDEARRETAVRVLKQDLHVPEHLARLLVELAVLFTKHAADDGAAAG